MNANRMIAVSLLGALPLLGLAQASKVCNGKDANNKDISGIACNGISVGRPKVFDNRSLTLKMEDLAKTLKTQQAANSPVDLKTVVAAINNLQGLSQQETDTSLSVVEMPHRAGLSLRKSRRAMSTVTATRFPTLLTGTLRLFRPA